MATIIKRKNKYSVVYRYETQKGEVKQKWETFHSHQDAVKRKAEVEYQITTDTYVPPHDFTISHLINEYVKLVGKKKWALSTYASNMALIHNYILPAIGDRNVQKFNVKAADDFYDKLCKTPGVARKNKTDPGYVTPNTIKDIHKILRPAFEKAKSWEVIAKNPFDNVTLPEVVYNIREIWQADQIASALETCEVVPLFLAINLAFACTMRSGEISGLQWKFVNVSKEAIDNDDAFLVVNQELNRASRDAMDELDKKDVKFIFPSLFANCSTELVLKTPKTKSSVRKIWIPKTFASFLAEYKKEQSFQKEALGQQYYDYDLVVCQANGRPVEHSVLSRWLKDLIRKTGLPDVVFHSLRHSSTTYKLMISGGDIKSTQGDTGHNDPSMVTKQYARILDESRKVNAVRFEKFFYNKTEEKPTIPNQSDGLTLLLEKIKDQPELVESLLSLVGAR